jgi:microcystin-dependent protein
MSEPYLGEIRAFGFPYAPRGWAQCQGQTMSISQNSALFALLGTMYGGDGRVTFRAARSAWSVGDQRRPGTRAQCPRPG